MIAGLAAARSLGPVTIARSAPASANLAKASQPGASQASASLDSGTVVPHSTPAATNAGKTRRLRKLIQLANPRMPDYLALTVFDQL